MFQSPGPVALHLGPIAIKWYGIIIAAAILICYFYVSAEIKRREMSRGPLDAMAFWVILSGAAGARLYYVLFNLDYYVENPLEILFIWRGGLAIHGALLGGAAAYFIFMARRRLSWRLYADIIMPGILFAQAIGRWGNFFNNEAFGSPTNLPWKLFIPEEFRPSGYIDFSYFHPTFLYESLWNLAGFVLLVLLTRKFFPVPSTQHAVPSHGIIFFTYLLWYSFGRFFVEALRLDSLYLGPLRMAQVASVIMFLIGIFGLIFLLKKSKLNPLYKP